MNFKHIFDVGQLEDEQIGHLQFVLNSPSYVDVFKPHLQQMRNSMNIRLLDPSETRKNEYPDDFLRGGIVIIDGLLALFERLIHETDMERIARSQITNVDALYEQKRQMGLVRPVTGIVEETYDPAEDY
jgi:hypothetical protein